MSPADRIRAARTDAECSAAWVAYADAGSPKGCDLDPEPPCPEFIADLKAGVTFAAASARALWRTREARAR